MTSKPVFVLSLDCEGKWGMADHLDAGIHSRLTTRSLDDAYRQLFWLLRTYQIPATMAFVGAGLLTPQQLSSDYEEAPPQVQSWLSHARHVTGLHAQGWSLREYALEALQEGHELASHGWSHTPFSWLDQAGAAFELQASQQALFEVAGQRAKTMIFPRNDMAHESLLPTFGFVVCRPKIQRAHDHLVTLGFSSLVRLLNGITAFHTTPPVQVPAHKGGVHFATPGHLLNLGDVGLRRLVPDLITHRRWTYMLQHHPVIHMWLHPHNLIKAPRLSHMFERLLYEVSVMRDDGRLDVMTLSDTWAATSPR